MIQSSCTFNPVFTASQKKKSWILSLLLFSAFHTFGSEQQGGCEVSPLHSNTRFLFRGSRAVKTSLSADFISHNSPAQVQWRDTAGKTCWSWLSLLLNASRVHGSLRRGCNFIITVRAGVIQPTHWTSGGIASFPIARALVPLALHQQHHLKKRTAAKSDQRDIVTRRRSSTRESDSAGRIGHAWG